MAASITPFPSTPPSKADPANFADRADALLGHLPTFVSDANALAAAVEADATDAEDAAAAAASAMAAAELASEAALASANFAGPWASLVGALSVPAAVSHSGRWWMLLQDLADVTTQEPGAAPTYWADIQALGSGGASQSGSITLTATSAAVQSVTPTGYGQSATLPDATTMSEGVQLFAIRNAGAYPYRIKNDGGTTLGFLMPGETTLVSLADNSTADGVWGLTNVMPFGTAALQRFADPAAGATNSTVRAIALDSDRTFIITNIGRYVFAVIYNHATNTWGGPTQVRDGGNSLYFSAIKCDTDKVLVVTCANASTAMETVVCSVSGTTITVNAANKASTTLAGALNTELVPSHQPDMGIIQVGSSFLLQYSRDTTTRGIRAITVSGTTPTVGNETALSGTSGTLLPMFAVTSSVALVFSVTDGLSTGYATPYTLSGSDAPAAGTGCSFTAGTTLWASTLGSRYVVLALSGSDLHGHLISVSGTTATDTNLTAITSGTSTPAFLPVGDKVVIAQGDGSNSVYVNYVYDNAGTLAKGTEVRVYTAASVNGKALFPDGTTACRLLVNSNNGYSVQAWAMDVSGASVAATPIGPQVDFASGYVAMFPTAGPGFYNASALLYDDHWAVLVKNSNTKNGILMVGDGLVLFRNIPTTTGNSAPVSGTKQVVVDFATTCQIEIQEMAKWY